MLIVFCVERPSKEGAPWVGVIELHGSSSCMGGLRSLLNTEGIFTLPIFQLSDGPLIQMWSASFAQGCRVLLSLSMIVKSLRSALGVLWRCGGFWWYWWFDWNSFFQGPVGFTYVFYCAVVGWAFPVVDYISFLSIMNRSLNAWVKIWFCWYL